MNVMPDINLPPQRANTIEPAHDLSASSLMWRAVLAQSVRDIYGEEPKQRLDVIRWLKSRDFETVCDFAHVEVISMRQQMAALVALPIPLARKYGKILRDRIMDGIHHDIG